MTSVKSKCPSCQHENDSEMSFCLSCGKALRAQVPGTIGNLCPRCGRFDQLSVRFCVYCGADTTAGATGSREFGKFTWEDELAHADKTVLTTHSNLPEVAQAGIVAGAAAVAAILGAATAFLTAPVLERANAQKAWPNSALVLYVNKDDAQVEIYRQERARTFTVGKVGAGGALKVSDLEPGPYICTVTAPNCQTSAIGYMPKLSIEPSCPTVIGYPDRFQLVPKHTDD